MKSAAVWACFLARTGLDAMLMALMAQRERERERKQDESISGHALGRFMGARVKS